MINPQKINPLDELEECPNCTMLWDIDNSVVHISSNPGECIKCRNCHSLFDRYTGKMLNKSRLDSSEYIDNFRLPYG